MKPRPAAALEADQVVEADNAPAQVETRPALPDAEMGGEAPCFAHLLDDLLEGDADSDQSGRV